MSYQELLSEIKQLPMNEQLLLLEALSRSVREGLTAKPSPKASPAEKLVGIAKPDEPLPSDEELKEMYVDYLVEKYH